MPVARCALESQLTGVAGTSGVYTEARGGSRLPGTPLSLLPGLGDSDRTCCPACEPEGLRCTGGAGQRGSLLWREPERHCPCVHAVMTFLPHTCLCRNACERREAVCLASQQVTLSSGSPGTSDLAQP